MPVTHGSEKNGRWTKTEGKFKSGNPWVAWVNPDYPNEEIHEVPGTTFLVVSTDPSNKDHQYYEHFNGWREARSFAETRG